MQSYISFPCLIDDAVHPRCDPGRAEQFTWRGKEVLGNYSSWGLALIAIYMPLLDIFSCPVEGLLQNSAFAIGFSVLLSLVLALNNCWNDTTCLFPFLV